MTSEDTTNVEVLRTKTRETASGFCSKCGIIRQDEDGYPVTDCVCTATMKHAPECVYIKVVSLWVSICGCEVHGLDACPDCDCTCGVKSSKDMFTMIAKDADVAAPKIGDE